MAEDSEQVPGEPPPDTKRSPRRGHSMLTSRVVSHVENASVAVLKLYHQLIYMK